MSAFRVAEGVLFKGLEHLHFESLGKPERHMYVHRPQCIEIYIGHPNPAHCALKAVWYEGRPLAIEVQENVSFTKDQLLTLRTELMSIGISGKGVDTALDPYFAILKDRQMGEFDDWGHVCPDCHHQWWAIIRKDMWMESHPPCSKCGGRGDALPP